MEEGLLLLAGPILRRVEPRLVSVWVALREKRKVRLSLWQGLASTEATSGLFTTTEAPLGEAEADPVRLGDHLHVTVVTLAIEAPTPALLPGTLYSYNVTFIGSGGQGETQDLNALGLLKDGVLDGRDHRALGYQTGALPGFALPPAELTDLRLVHGSCRKPHGNGRDGLAFLDHLIETTRTNGQERPHQLFLTGDQIYADEVGRPLLPRLTELGQALLGAAVERLPTTEGGQEEEDDGAEDGGDGAAATPGVVLWPADQQHFPAGRRQKLMLQQARFTSGSANAHLLSFGEFCAMYLCAWSNTLWPRTLATAEDVYDLKKPAPPTDALLTKIEEDDLEKLREDFAAEVERLGDFKETLPKARRALANVPVYMIFDDHEVTDDWYLTDLWRHQVLTAPLGRAVLRNALVAYALFQAWGNDPKAFETGPGAKLLTLAPKLFEEGKTQGPDPAAAAELEALFGMNVADPVQKPEGLMRWHYAVPGPKHQVLVLDTRNWRAGESLFSAPALIAPKMMEEQIPKGPRPEGVEVSFVASAAPVLGLPFIEELLQPGYTRFLDIQHAHNPEDHPIGAAGKDPEAWSFEPYALEALLKRLAEHGRVVFLSGDVHYALVAELTYFAREEKATALAEAARFVQLTASPLKNEESHKDVTLYQTPLSQFLFEHVELPVERLGWDKKDPNPVKLPGGRRLPQQHASRLRRSPILLSTLGWPGGTTLDPLPNWAWRFRLVGDGRPDDATPGGRPKVVHPRPLEADVNPEDNPAAGYQQTLLRHVQALEKSNPRFVLFASNVGLVRCERARRLVLTEDVLKQLAGTVEPGVHEKLASLKDRQILEANFRSIVKATAGIGLPVAVLDAIQAAAVASEGALAVRQQLYALHPDALDAPAVYAEHVAALESTGEPVPAMPPVEASDPEPAA